MTELVNRIQDLIAAPGDDLEAIERTLTDGYAQALSLEAQQQRIERRIADVAKGIDNGDTAEKVRELSKLSRQLNGCSVDAAMLRRLLGELRSRVDDVRQMH